MAQTLDRIGFLVHNPEMFNHYQSVWAHMPAGSVEVVTSGSEDELEQIASRCQALGLPCRDARQLLATRQRLGILVSSFPASALPGCNTSYLNQAIGDINLRFMYATGKAGWNFQPWNASYDSILCFGPYQAQKLESFRDTLKVQMGYPRFDRFFNQPLDRAKALRQRGLDPARKTLVWLPTWSSLSSIDLFADSIATLQRDYNVIVKPHPLTLSGEPERMQKLAGFACCIREHIDNVELFQLADFLLCDYGGSAFGGIYTDRNLILLDLPGAAQDEVMGEDSSDILLRRVIPHLDAEQARRLPELLQDEGLWQAQAAIRRRLSQYFFAPFHGFAAEVAALAIVNSPKSLRR